jgi:hypothetical protein
LCPQFVVLSLLAVHCHCAEVLEVSGDNVVRTSDLSLPLKTVSGISHLRSLPLQTSYLSTLPHHLNYGVSSLSGLSGLSGLSTYGLGLNNLGLTYGNLGLNNLGLNNLGLNNRGLNNLGYLSNIRTSVLQPQVVNIAPQLHRQSLLAIRQPSLAIAQPALSYAERAAVIARPQLSVAVRPQVLSLGATEAIRPVNAAITQIARTVEYRPVPYSDQPIVPQEIVVEPSDQPINIHFKSRSSTVRISQEHIPGEPGTIEQTQSQDEPSRVVHEVVKPVIQEVKEVIQPYRQVTQEVQPVVENVHRVVSQGEGQRLNYVSEPIARQLTIQQVRPLSVQQVQPLSVQQVQPLSVAVQQPSVAISQIPSLAINQGSIAVAQPQISQIQTYVRDVPRIQTLSLNAVPQLQSIGYNQLIGYNRGLEPIRTEIVRTPQITRIAGVAQPIVGVNRVLAVRDNRDNRDLVREVRVQKQDQDYVNYAESE